MSGQTQAPPNVKMVEGHFGKMVARTRSEFALAWVQHIEQAYADAVRFAVEKVKAMAERQWDALP